MLFHDYTPKRTIGEKRSLHHLTLKQLRQLDLGSWFSSWFAGERIITLPEALDIINHRCPVVLDLKSRQHDREQFATALVKSIRASRFRRQIILASRDHPIEPLLAEKAKNLRQARPGFFHHKFGSPFRRMRSQHHHYLISNFYLTSKKLVRKAHQAKLKVFAWSPSTKKCER